MTLGELIEFLRKRPKGRDIRYGFSWGYVSDKCVRFQPLLNTSVGDLIDCAESVLEELNSDGTPDVFIGWDSSDQEPITEALLSWMMGRELWGICEECEEIEIRLGRKS